VNVVGLKDCSGAESWKEVPSPVNELKGIAYCAVPFLFISLGLENEINAELAR